MKKILLFLAIIIAASTVNAQLFIGGGVGFDRIGGSTKIGSTTVNNPSVFTIQFAPKVGFYLNDDFALGVSLGVMNSSVTEPEDDIEIVNNELRFTAAAFARYRLIGNDKVSLLLDGEIGGGKISSKTKRGSTTMQGNPTLLFSFGVTPVISYSISDRLDIEASSDFLRFGFTMLTDTDLDNADFKDTTTHFGLGVNALTPNLDIGRMVPPLLTVGVTFKF